MRLAWCFLVTTSAASLREGCFRSGRLVFCRTSATVFAASDRSSLTVEITVKDSKLAEKLMSDWDLCQISGPMSLYILLIAVNFYFFNGWFVLILLLFPFVYIYSQIDVFVPKVERLDLLGGQWAPGKLGAMAHERLSLRGPLCSKPFDHGQRVLELQLPSKGRWAKWKIKECAAVRCGDGGAHTFFGGWGDFPIFFPCHCWGLEIND